VITTTVAVVVVVLIGLPTLAWMEGAQAAAGFTVRNLHPRWTFGLPVLAVQAVPATVAWTSEPPAALADLAKRRCLIYLGQGSDMSIFYEVATGDSLRIPTGEIVITLRNMYEVPSDC
jgi:hypothetical protein